MIFIKKIYLLLYKYSNVERNLNINENIISKITANFLWEYLGVPNTKKLIYNIKNRLNTQNNRLKHPITINISTIWKNTIDKKIIKNIFLISMTGSCFS